MLAVLFSNYQCIAPIARCEAAKLSRKFICLGLIGRMYCVFPRYVLQNVGIVVSSGIVEP